MTYTSKSDAFESIHSTSAALLEIDTIDKAAMCEFDASCIADVPAEIKPDQIKQARENTYVSKSPPGT